MIPKKWVLLSRQWKQADIEQMKNQVEMPPLLAVALLNRKVTPEGAPEFLKKSLAGIVPPENLLDMDKAVARIAAAIEAGEKIVVYGDYDVDGITSTTMLYDFLKSEGAEVSYYVPDRQDEGYGINILAVQKFKKAGVGLMITVDCGITAVGEVAFANSIGLSVVITDHHICGEKLPAACAVVNPHRAEDSYPFPELAGVGVCFKLVLALAMARGHRAQEYFSRYVDLCAIGTIADVVPLIGENRIMVAAGLKQLATGARPGLAALLSVAGLLGEGKPLTATAISFGIAPRINAAGRVGQATLGVELLLSQDEKKACELAQQLNQENSERQRLEKQILEEAEGAIAADAHFAEKSVIVLAKEGWHQGVIGIVASRLLDKYYKPTVLISLIDGKGKGSGRSVEGINLYEGLSACQEELIQFGGHEMAAGLSIAQENIPAFGQKLDAYVKEQLAGETPQPTLYIDETIGVKQVSPQTVEMMHTALSPFGAGNPEPVYELRGAAITSLRRIGEGERHVKLVINKDGCMLPAVGFSMAWIADRFVVGDVVDMAFCMNINHYGGTDTVQAVVKDMKTATA